MSVYIYMWEMFRDEIWRGVLCASHVLFYETFFPPNNDIDNQPMVLMALMTSEAVTRDISH